MLGLTLGLMVIALTPAVGNAADKIFVPCRFKTNMELFPLQFILTEKAQEAQLGDRRANVEISFDIPNNIIFLNLDTRDVFKIDTVSGELSFGDGKHKTIEEATKVREWIDLARCTFADKHLSLIPKSKKPVSTSVQQRLQALEERMDRVESSMKK